MQADAQQQAVSHAGIDHAHLGAASSSHKCNKLGMVVHDQTAQRVLHHEASHCQQGPHLAEAVCLIAALIQVVPPLP